MTRPDGIDVAHYQLDVAWDRVKAAGVFWAACKATQATTYVDPKFERNRQGMTAAGFRHRFFYHWLSPNVDTLAQAAHYLKVVGPLHPGEGVLLDAEEDGITSAQALVWCQAVEKVTGRPVAIYTGAYIGAPRLWTDTKLFDGRRARILAAYTTEAKAKALPGVAAHPWDAWQYTSTGSVDGVPNPVDFDQIDNVAIFDLACGRDLPAPVPPPAPKPTPDPITPIQGAEMSICVVELSDAKAAFLAECTPAGGLLRLIWVDGSDPNQVAAFNLHLAESTTAYACRAGLSAKRLPPGDPRLWDSSICQGLFVNKIPVGDALKQWRPTGDFAGIA